MKASKEARIHDKWKRNERHRAVVSRELDSAMTASVQPMYVKHAYDCIFSAWGDKTKGEEQ